MIEFLSNRAITVDWQAVAGFAGSIAIIWAAYLARATLKDIRRHHASVAEVSTAQAVLEALYKVERSLFLIRDPQHIPFVNAFDHLVETEGVHAAELRKVEYYSRQFEMNRAPFDEMSALIPRARAIFGDDVARNMVAICGCDRRIAASIQQIRNFSELGRDLYGPKNVHPGLTLDDGQILDREVCREKYWPILQSDLEDKSKMDQQFRQPQKFLEEVLVPIIRTSSSRN